MTHPASRLRLPEEIKTQTISFLNWYFDDIHHVPEAPALHVEGADYDYDWRPRAGAVSRLTLTDRSSGLVAMNGFDFNKISGEEALQQPPPFSLLMTTWFDLCFALEWITEGRRAELDERLHELTGLDQHRLGEALYG